MKVLNVHEYYRRGLAVPTEIPTAWLEPIRERVQGFHGGQTLECLDERGGLSPGELYMHALHKPPIEMIEEAAACAWLAGWRGQLR